MADNHLVLHGNQTTMNLENILYLNVLQSPYFKDLLAVKTYHEVLEEVKHKVQYIGPWVPNAAKTPSTAFVLLFKLFTLKLTVKQLTGMLNSPNWSFRGLAFLYLRYTCDPKKLWEWYEPYLEDEDEMIVYLRAAPVQTKQFLRKMIKDHKYEETIFPRIPVPVQKEMMKKLDEHNKQFNLLDIAEQGILGGEDQGPEDYEPLDRERDRDRRGGGRGYGGDRDRDRGGDRDRRNYRRHSRSRSPRRRSRSRSRDRRRSRSRSRDRRRSRSPRRRSPSPRRSYRDRSRSRSPRRFSPRRDRSRSRTPPKTSPRPAGDSAALQKIKAMYGATTSTKLEDTKSKKDSMQKDTILLGSFK